MIDKYINIFLILKIIFLLVDIFYIIFLFILLNRVLSMSKIVREEHDEVILKSVVIFKIFLAISLFLLALAIL